MCKNKFEGYFRRAKKDVKEIREKYGSGCFEAVEYLVEVALDDLAEECENLWTYIANRTNEEIYSYISPFKVPDFYKELINGKSM